MPEHAAPRQSSRLPRIRVSVRALLLLVLVFGCWLGWYIPRVQSQRDAVSAIRRAGGSVSYDWQWGDYNPDIVDPNGKPRAPKWLARLVDVDYVANVVHVSLVPQRLNAPNRASDETLTHLEHLTHLEFICLNDTAVTDAGLAHLKGLTRLNTLELWHTQISDAGLAQLTGLVNLRLMLLAGTRVTDDGVLKLEAALPRVHILREEDMALNQNLRRATDDLDFARSQPIRLACLLLRSRASLMANRGNMSEFIATLHALCDLEAIDKVSLFNVAQARFEALVALEPSRSPKLSDSERRALQRLCADRGIAASTRAIELGYDDVARAKRLIETMRAMRPAN